jgi:hypothetical protein
MPIWPILQKTPWWWTQIIHHELRVQQILELAAIDDDHEPPGRDLWYSGARRDLDAWIKDRQDRHKTRGLR